MNKDHHPDEEFYQDSTPKHVIGYTEKDPGLIVLLLDQSGSMADPWSKEDGRKKMDVAAHAINQICGEISIKCRSGNEFVNKIFLAIIGYNTDDSGQRPRTEVICYGWAKEVVHIWHEGYPGTERAPGERIEAHARGGTPMDAAFRRAADLIRSAQEGKPIFQGSFPPTVINITDGEADGFRDGQGEGENVRAAAEDLRAICSKKGSLTLINVLIDPASKGEVFFDLPDEPNRNVEFLYLMASRLPKYMRTKAGSIFGMPIPEEKRGLVIADKPETLVKVLRWGSYDNTVVR